MNMPLVRFRFPRAPSAGKAAILAAGSLLAVLFVLPVPLSAQEWSEIIFRAELEDPGEDGWAPHPYFVGYMGNHQPSDDAYSQVFSDALISFGGGLGVRAAYLGAEVMLRRGSIERSHIYQDTARRFYFSSMEAQVRFYVVPRQGKFAFPVGAGLGLVSVTVDRGYQGVFDRFNGTGFHFAPFAGAEYTLLPGFSLGLEIEYSINEADFNNNTTWESHYGGALTGRLPTPDPSFWDTVGGSENRSFDGGGVAVALRVVVYIPTFQGE